MTLLGAGPGEYGSCPEMRFKTDSALYVASPTLAYSVVPWEPPNEFGYSEIAWTSLGNIRLWGALAFAIEEGQGYYSFYPVDSQVLYFGSLRDEAVMQRIAERLAARNQPQSDLLHRRRPPSHEVSALYDALLRADHVLLRGVSCFLKGQMLRAHEFFREEMGFNLYISLEAGLSVLRQRLSPPDGRLVPFGAVFEFVSRSFSHGDALAGFWEDVHDDRNALLHPANEFSPYAIQPMCVEEIWDLVHPMLSLYRYLLIGKPRPV